MLADITVTINWIYYSAAIGLAGLIATVLVKVARRFDLSAFPFWALLMMVGAGTFGFAVADMPEGPPTSRYNDSARNAEILKSWEPEAARQEPRLLPRSVDGALCVGGIGMFVCGLVMLGVRLFGDSAIDKPDALFRPELNGVLKWTDRIEKLVASASTPNAALTKEISSHLNILHNAMTALIDRQNKTSADVLSRLDEMARTPVKSDGFLMSQVPEQPPVATIDFTGVGPWTRWKAQKPEVGRKVQAQREYGTVADALRARAPDDFVRIATDVGFSPPIDNPNDKSIIVDDDFEYWWRYVGQMEKQPEPSEKEWVSFKDSLPMPGRAFHWRDSDMVFGRGRDDLELVKMKASGVLVYLNERLKGMTPPTTDLAAFYDWEWRYV